MAGVPPVFFKVTEEGLTIYELCKAAEVTAGEGSIHGAQRIRGLWRVYPNTSAARVELLAKGTIIKGKRVELLSRNPFILRDGDGREIPVTKLFVAGVPISFSNDEIIKALKKTGFVIRSKLDDERVRDPSGRLTNWVTGRRMCWIDIPTSQMPTSVDAGLFRASLFYKEMVRKITCNRCLLEGHKAVDCKGEEACRRCRMTGHRMASCPVAWGLSGSAGGAAKEGSKEVRRDEKMNEKRRDDDVEKCGEVQEEGERRKEQVEEERGEDEEEAKSTEEEMDESSEGEVRESDGESEKEGVSFKRKEEEEVEEKEEKEEEEERKETRGDKEKRRQSKKNEGKEIEKVNNTGRKEKKERGRAKLKEGREKKTPATLDSFVIHRPQSRKRTQSPEETSQSQRPKLGEVHANKKV